MRLPRPSFIPSTTAFDLLWRGCPAKTMRGPIANAVREGIAFLLPEGKQEGTPAGKLAHAASSGPAVEASVQPAAATPRKSGSAKAATVAGPGKVAAGTAACSCCAALWKSRYGLLGSDGAAVTVWPLISCWSPHASCRASREGIALEAASSCMTGLYASLASPLPENIGSLQTRQLFSLQVVQRAHVVRRPCSGALK